MVFKAISCRKSLRESLNERDTLRTGIYAPTFKTDEKTSSKRAEGTASGKGSYAAILKARAEMLKASEAPFRAPHSKKLCFLGDCASTFSAPVVVELCHTVPVVRSSSDLLFYTSKAYRAVRASAS